jgi:hypothetical protein
VADSGSKKLERLLERIAAKRDQKAFAELYSATKGKLFSTILLIVRRHPHDKANARKLNVGHAGVGSVSYIGCLLLNAALVSRRPWSRLPERPGPECDALR